MKKFAMLLGLCLAFTLTMMAQDNMGNMGQSDKDQSMSKSDNHKAGAKGMKEHTMTGCLSAGSAPDTYMLTNGRHKNGIMVTGPDELKNHVGHEVKLSGMWEKGGMSEASESSAMEKQEKKSGKEERVFKATNITHLADTCTAGSASKKGKKKDKDNMGAGTPPSM